MVKFSTSVLAMVLLWLAASPACAGSDWQTLEWSRRVSEMEKRADAFRTELNQLKRFAESLEARGASLPSIVQGRLTPTTGVPVTIAATTNNARVRFTPYKGDYISLYYRGNWRLLRFTEVFLLLAGTAINSNYDVFAYRASLGTVALELSAAWTSDTVRNNALALQDGVWVLASDPTRRYLGTLRTNGTADRFNDRLLSRGLWNYYNRVRRNLRRFDGTNTWNYGVNTYRQARAAVANDVEFVIGIDEALTKAQVKTNNISAAAANRSYSVGIGIDSTTTNSAQLLGTRGNGSATTQVQSWAEYTGYVGIGFHTLSWNEIGISAANVTNWGDNGNTTSVESGLLVEIEG